MGIWGAVKNALNSTIGTSKAKALNDIIDDRLYINLIEKDVADSEINNILNNSAKTITSTTATLIGTYVATHDDNLTINVTGYNTNTSSSYPSYIGYSVDREVTTTSRAAFYGSDGVDEYATIAGNSVATVSFKPSVKEGQTVRIYAISYSTSTSYKFNYSKVEVISHTFRAITTLEKYGITDFSNEATIYEYSGDFYESATSSGYYLLPVTRFIAPVTGVYEFSWGYYGTNTYTDKYIYVNHLYYATILSRNTFLISKDQAPEAPTMKIPSGNTTGKYSLGLKKGDTVLLALYATSTTAGGITNPKITARW